MAVLLQGLVLMIAGMGIVYFFLSLLIFVTKFTMGGVAQFNALLPDETPKKKPVAAASNDDANIALAIAVALRG